MIDLLTIPIWFSHECLGDTCINQTQYITLDFADFLVIGINSMYGFLIAKFYLDSRKKADKITERSSE